MNLFPGFPPHTSAYGNYNISRAGASQPFILSHSVWFITAITLPRPYIEIPEDYTFTILHGNMSLHLSIISTHYYHYLSECHCLRLILFYETFPYTIFSGKPLRWNTCSFITERAWRTVIHSESLLLLGTYQRLST